MNDILDQVESWHQEGKELAIATVVDTWGSAPRPVGSKLAVTLEGEFAGSVSAGCVESAVVEASRAVISSGRPELLTFGVSDDEAWEVGLACGGTIRVLVEPFSAWQDVFPLLLQQRDGRNGYALLSAIPKRDEGHSAKLFFGDDGMYEGDIPQFDHYELIMGKVQECLARGRGSIWEIDEEMSIFIDVYPRPPRLVIIGAVHIAESLIAMATLLGFETFVIDPRPAFASSERFPQATAILCGWPEDILPDLDLDQNSYMVMLTHDPKIDDPALQFGLGSNACYIGALGSKRTNGLRLQRLRDAGLSKEQLARLHAPIGIYMGGNSPGEIAVSIMAEILQIKNGLLPVDAN